MWRTDGRTDGPTDTVTYRVACTRLKIEIYFLWRSEILTVGASTKSTTWIGRRERKICKGRIHTHNWECNIDLDGKITHENEWLFWMDSSTQSLTFKEGRVTAVLCRKGSRIYSSEMWNVISKISWTTLLTFYRYRTVFGLWHISKSTFWKHRDMHMWKRKKNFHNYFFIQRPLWFICNFFSIWKR